jgi:hypothetical protein
MRLQDLERALADSPCQDREGWYVMAVARRVAALFEDCGRCRGSCVDPLDGPEGQLRPCDDCNGTGGTPTDKCRTLVDGHHPAEIRRTLAVYFFSEG